MSQPAEAVVALDLRDSVAAGRGTLTDFNLSYRDWVRPPDLMIGEVTPALMRQYFEQTTVLGASLYEIPDAEVASAGFILTDGRFNLSAQLNLWGPEAENHCQFIAAQLPSLARRAVVEEAVLLAGSGHLLYGHWLVDFLPKLYLLNLAGYDIRGLRYLLPFDTPTFARLWLALLGIPEGRLLVYDPATERLACRRLLVPTSLRFGSRASPLMREARDFILERIAPSRFGWRGFGKARAQRRKLFVARSINAGTLGRRHLLQREQFEARALAHGFEIVRPEAMKISDQISLFRSAATIFGEYGSGMHGSLFAPSGATVLSVRDNGVELGFLQTSLDHTLGHASGYLFGTARDEAGNFSVRLEDIDMAFDWLGWRSRS